MQGFANFLIKQRWLVIIFFLIVTIFLALGAVKVRLNESFDAILPDHSPVLELDEEIAAVFGETPEGAVVVLEADNIFTPEVLVTIRDIANKIAEIDEVEDTISIANSSKFQDDDGFLLIEDMLPATGDISEEQIADAQAFLETSYIYQDTLLVSEDGRLAPIYIQLDPDVHSRVFDAELQKVIEENWSGPSYISGAPAIEAVLQSVMQRDLPLLTALAGLLILIMLFLNFRNIQGALLPLLTVTIGLIWSLGLLGYLGMDMTSISVIAPVAIMAVGSSFSLHLLSRYYYELAHGKEKNEAIRLMLAETGLGVLVSGIAIAAAMLTFLVSEISGVRGLGLQTAAGVLSALVAALLLLPAMLSLLPRPKNVIDPEAAGAIGNFLRAIADNVSRFRRVILALALVIVAVSIVGATRIRANTDTLGFFPKGTPIRQNTELIEENFNGAGTLVARVTADLADPKILNDMLTFQERVLAEVDGLGSSQSIATALREIHQVLTGEAAMPATREAVAQELLMWQLSADDPSDITEVITLDNTQGLITITAGIVSSQETRQMMRQMDALAEEIFDDSVQLDYSSRLIENLASEDALLKDFILSLTLALILVIIIDSFVRSFRAAVVTILALLMTIAMQYGFLGFLNVDLDIATMLLGALAIGVGDYAIHLTVRYMEERRKGLAPEEAMHDSIISSGRAILFTALTLGAGFCPLIFGSVMPVSRLGSFMVFTVVAVGVASLTLLPAACLTFLRNPQGQQAES